MTVRESLPQIWAAYDGESNRTGKFRHIAELLGYSKAEVEGFLEEPEPGYHDDDGDGRLYIEEVL